MSASKELSSQLTRSVAQLPGWGLLLVTVYVVLRLLSLPTSGQVFLGRIPLSAEVVAAGVTLFTYLLGDLVDQVVYDGAERKWHPDVERTRFLVCREQLHVWEGSYHVMKHLALAAGAFQSFRIHWFSELAKWLRSLILPGVVVAGVLVCRRHYDWAVVIGMSAVVCLPAFIWLKAGHKRNLYRLASRLAGTGKMRSEDQGNTRMFFWDGIFVAAAVRVSPEELDKRFPAGGNHAGV